MSAAFPTFEEDRAEFERLFGRRNLEDAYGAAERLVGRYPDRTEAYQLLNLVTCVSNRGGGARHADHIRENAARYCHDYDLKLGGDMQRDQAIGLIRFAPGPRHTDLDRAERIIGDARLAHLGDPDRLACLLDVNGRLLYARRRFKEAANAHRMANAAWMRIGDHANSIWVYNNKVHWLKAVVAGGGRNSAEARRLEREIRTDRPKGAVPRGREARVIRGLPLGAGNLVHDWITRHR